MATTKAKRKPSMSADEQAAEKALDTFAKQYEGKKLTDNQKEQKRELQATLGKLKFVRIANKRVPRAVAAIEGIGNLSGKQYVKSEKQIKAICDRLDEAVKGVRQALMGTKETESGFVLPGFEDAPQK